MLDLASNDDGTPLSGTDIDRYLLDRSERSDPSPIARVVAEHLASGGGRERARLAHDTCRCAGHGPASALAVAACVEALHQASLVHDDLTDRSATRRGRPAVWHAHGDAVAIAAGDHLISLSFACLAQAEDVDPRRGLALAHRAVSSTIRGQCAEQPGAEDTGTERGADVFARWSGIAAQKTGPLLALGPELAMSGRDGDRESAAMRAACRKLALGYQALDDCRDRAEDRRGEGATWNLSLRLEAEGLTPAEAVETAALHGERALRAAMHDAARIPDGLGAPVARLGLRKLRAMEAHLDAL